MTRFKLAAILSIILPAMASAAEATTDVKTIVFFQNHKITPLDAQETRSRIQGKTVSFKNLAVGSVESVYYGVQRVDAKGTKTKYRVTKDGIEEDFDDAPRSLILYVWQQHTFVCLENLGDLDVLDGAEDTCPYEIVSAVSGNNLAEQ